MNNSKFANTLAAFAVCASVMTGISSAYAAEEGSAATAEMTTKIETMLKEQGYDVRKVQMEDGKYEAYALKDGKKFEIYLDADLKITDTKESD
jgi:hypothetical protein